MGKPLYLIDVLNKELGLSLSYTAQTISSPFRRDSNPSFRVYGIGADGEDRGAYDWGTSKSYNVYSFIMEYFGLTFKDAVKYLSENYSDYDLTYNPSSGVANGVYSLFKHSTPVTTLSEAKLLEKSLLTYFNDGYNGLLVKNFFDNWIEADSSFKVIKV